MSWHYWYHLLRRSRAYCLLWHQNEKASSIKIRRKEKKQIGPAGYAPIQSNPNYSCHCFYTDICNCCNNDNKDWRLGPAIRSLERANNMAATTFPTPSPIVAASILSPESEVSSVASNHSDMLQNVLHYSTKEPLPQGEVTGSATTLGSSSTVASSNTPNRSVGSSTCTDSTAKHSFSPQSKKWFDQMI